MSISSLNIGTQALSAHQIALEVTGQNIANVNNPNYTRQRAHLVTTPPLLRSFGQVGTGVTVDGIQQIKDAFIDLQIRNQMGESGKYQVAADVYDQMEAIFNEPSDIGINALLGEFFDSLYDLSLSPESVGIRDVVVKKAQTLAGQIQFVNSQIDQLRLDLNTTIKNTVTEINTLTQQIAALNKEIVKTEAGTTNGANDLRDQREAYVKELAELTNLTISEQETGELNISIGGVNVVFGGNSYDLGVTVRSGDELPVHDVVLEATGAVINFTSGEMYSYVQGRDTIATKYRDELDELARTLIDEVNRIHVDGRGLQGFTNYTSVNGVSDATAVLQDAGLDMTPASTSFDIVVIDESTGAETTTTVTVDVTTDSLNDVAAAIDGIANLSATVGSDGTLSVAADSGYRFAFSNVSSPSDESSNLLSALGINTFFTGTDAQTIDINTTLVNDGQYLAAAQSASLGDNTNVLLMAELRNSTVADGDTKTIEEFYHGMIVELGSDTQEAHIRYEGASGYLEQLTLRRESVSGVNLDEEAANLILYQRGYEAAARYIGVIDSLLNTLINGII